MSHSHHHRHHASYKPRPSSTWSHAMRAGRQASTVTGSVEAGTGILGSGAALLRSGEVKAAVEEAMHGLPRPMLLGLGLGALVGGLAVLAYKSTSDLHAARVSEASQARTDSPRR